MLQWEKIVQGIKDYILDGSFAQRFKRHDESPFILYADVGNGVYRHFTTEENRDLWVAAYEAGEMTPEIAALEFTPAFTAPAPYSINVTALKDNQYVLLGTKGTKLSFSFQTVDGKGSELNESVDAYYTFKSTSGTHQTSKIYNAGTVVSLNIDDYLHLGTNAITILLRGRSTGTTKTVIATYYVVQLDLTSTFDIARSILPKSNFSCTYTVVGQADKIVEFYIDGTLVATSTVSSLESSATRTQVFNNSDGHLVPGKHSLQLRALMMAGDQQFYSSLLYYEFVISGIDQIHIMMACEFPNTASILVGQVPGLSGEQYVTKSLEWAYYNSDPMVKTSIVTWRLYTEAGQETTLATRNADIVEAETDKKPDPLEFMPTDYGDYKLQALIDNEIIASYTISVIPNTNGIIEATEGLTMKLSGLGRSNDEPSDTLTSLADRGYSAQFYNMPFNGNAGYIDNAVVFNNGAYCIINNKPFAEEIAVQSNNGNVVEIDFMSFNVDNEEAIIFQIGDYNPASTQNGPSLTIYPTKAILRSNLGTELIARFKSDERVKLAFITHPNTISHTQYPRFMLVQNQGVLAPGVVYDPADNFNIGTTSDQSNYGMIRVGDPNGKAGIKLYYLRTYSNTYSQWQGLNNFIIDSGGDLSKLIEKNNIFQAGSSTEVDIDKLEGSVPLVKITGDVTPLIATQSKATIYGGFEITFPDDPELYAKGDSVQFSNAGQSTLGLHMAPSMHVKFDKNNNILYDRDGNPYPKNRWTFRKGNVPEKKVRLQANPMDSSGCHNGAFLRMVNHSYPNVQINGEYVLRIPSQDYVLSSGYSRDMAAKYGGNQSDYQFPYTINYVPDSRPCVVVWRLNKNSPYKMLGLYVLMEEKKSNYANGMKSIYDKIDSDGKVDPFDFKIGSKGNRLWDNEGCRQMENLRNHKYTLFSSYQNFESDAVEREYAYEMEYPDPDDVIADGGDVNTYWIEFGKELVEPLCNTFHNQEEFNKIIFNIIDKWHTAAYYRNVMRHCCTDSLVRNLEWTRYEPNGKWIPKWWDVDMQNGLQQTGACDAQPMTDRDTKMNGVYVMSGRDNEGNSSWLWDALEANDEFMEAVRLIDQALFDAGWDYKGITDYQDNEYIDQWSPALYNKDGEQKYILPYLEGNNYLVMFQGDRTSHRHWFEKTSFDYWDAKWVTGDFKNKSIYVRAGGANKANTMHFVAGATSYFGYGQTQDIALSGLYHTKGEAFDMRIQSETPLLVNDPIQIYAANKLEAIDLNEIAEFISSTVQLDKCYDEVTGTLLKKLIVGISKERMAEGVINRQDNIGFTGLNLLNRMEYLDIQGLNSSRVIVDLSKMVNLKEFYAAGSGILAFNPADGSDLTAVELPNTVTTITMNGVNLTANGNDCAISWWKLKFDGPNIVGVEGTTCPTSLQVLRLTAMGYDIGTHKLVKSWIDMLSNNPSLINYAQIHYRGINWTDFEVEDLLLLAKIPVAQRELTGYIRCNREYTIEEMNILLSAFGENVFSISNANSGLCCDCDSTNIVISASGPGTSIDSEGVINLIQGNTTQLKAVGFPLSAGDSTYEWMLIQNNETIRGNEQLPYISFDGNRMHYRTGTITSEEGAWRTTNYNIHVTSSLGGSGDAILKVIERTYPEQAVIDIGNTTARVIILNNVINIVSIGHVKIDATHLPPGYNGRMLANGGGTWQLSGDTAGIRNCKLDYTPGMTEDTEFCLEVISLTDDDKDVTIDYKSHWRNGLELTSNTLHVSLFLNNERILGSDSVTGNEPLFKAFEKMGLTHELPYYYSTLELRALGDALDIGTSLDAAGIPRSSLITTLDGEVDILSVIRNSHSYANECFKNCTNLEFVVVPDWVTTIGKDCFDGCTYFGFNIEFKSTTVPTITTRLMQNDPWAIYVPDSSINDYKNNPELSQWVDHVIEPSSDKNKACLCFDDGNRIRFDSNNTVLL